MNIFRFTNFDMGVGNGSFKKQIIYRLGYRTYWGNIRLTFHISILKILFFSLWFMISQKLSMKLEPCNSTQGAPFQYIINIKLYLYLGSFCSSVRGIIIQTKTLIAQSIEFSFRLLFAWVIKVIVKLSQWNLPHIQSNVDVKLSIFFFFWKSYLLNSQ